MQPLTNEIQKNHSESEVIGVGGKRLSADDVHTAIALRDTAWLGRLCIQTGEIFLWISCWPQLHFVRKLC